MKKVLLALALMVLLSMLASAKNDSVTTGPYKISFDIGLTRNDYNITVKEPKATEGLSGDKRTEYYVSIVNNTGLFRYVGITVRSLETPIPIASGSNLAQALNSMYSDDPRASGLRTDARTIDGTSGGVASFSYKLDSGIVLDGYQVDYQPIFDPTHNVVEIVSYYPWTKEH